MHARNLGQAEEHHRDRGPNRLSLSRSFVPVAPPVFLVVMLELLHGIRLAIASSSLLLPISQRSVSHRQTLHQGLRASIRLYCHRCTRNVQSYGSPPGGDRLILIQKFPLLGLLGDRPRVRGRTLTNHRRITSWQSKSCSTTTQGAHYWPASANWLALSVVRLALGDATPFSTRVGGRQK